MAIWQFKVEFVPNVVVARHDVIPEEEWADCQWWVRSIAPSGLLEDLACLLPSHRSWSEDLSQWGSQDSDLIEIWRENGKIESVSARIDMRNLDLEFVRDLSEIANEGQCRLIYSRYRTVLPQDYAELVGALLASPTFKALKHPEEWLPKMANEVLICLKPSPDVLEKVAEHDVFSVRGRSSSQKER